MILLCLRCSTPFLAHWQFALRDTFYKKSARRKGHEWREVCPATCERCRGKEKNP